ncbi:Rho termination factor, N-terminal [Dillenia turbinata]|uniref:Rho termination factor, N-terminal n=1 Tax=Dillenia turbinata TaxID=194707 RepID=A0AAN8ZGW9_9MAGN
MGHQMPDARCQMPSLLPHPVSYLHFHACYGLAMGHQMRDAFPAQEFLEEPLLYHPVLLQVTIGSSHTSRLRLSNVLLGNLLSHAMPILVVTKETKTSRGNINKDSPEAETGKMKRETIMTTLTTELFSSKNGSLLSSSNGPKFQATADPGPREKEIVELFRKVQAQLRERAALKEEQKHEAMQGQGKESETVDSLLKLLRKHSAEQGRKRNSRSSRDVIAYRPEQNGAFREEKSTNFFDSNRFARDGAQESRDSSPSRPRSNFRRKSPVPPVKYQPVYSTEGSVNSTSHLNSSGSRETSSIETLPVSEPEDFVKSRTAPEPEGELDLELEPGFSDEPVLDEMSDFEPSDTDEAYNDEGEEGEKVIQQTDLSAMKLADLRLLAKSRGLKGFSKLKKQELVALLDGHPT